MRNDSGRISVTAGSGDQVVIRATLRAHRRGDERDAALQRIRAIEANPPVEQSGSTIRIGHFADSNADRGVSITYEITTPVNTSIRSTNDSGGQSVTGIDGPVNLTADSGGIKVAQVRGEVRVQADSGGIDLTDIGGNVVAHADSGGIRAMNVAGSLDLQTDSGGIQLSQTRPAAVKAHADSGGITAKLVANAGYDVEAASSSGQVTSDAPLTVSGQISRHKLRGKLGGGGPLVSLQTDSGNVRIH